MAEAAKRARIGKHTVYTRYHQDPEFQDSWDAAVREAGERLLLEARRRAVDGTEEPVYQKGECVGFVRRYSDVLLIFLIKGIYPQYRDSHVVQSVKVDPSKWTDAQLAAYRDGLPLERVLAMAPVAVASIEAAALPAPPEPSS